MKKLSKINEDVTDIYSRLVSGKKRQEEGKEVETPLGKVFLKDPFLKYDKIIEAIINNANSDYFPSVNINSIQLYSTDEIKNIRTGLSYSILLDNGGHGADLVAEFTDYEDVKAYDEDVLYDASEEDYISICQLIGKYLNDNVDLQKPQGYQEDYVLYLGDASDVDEFFYDDFKSEFENEFSPRGDLKFWSYQYDNSIGIELDYDNLLAYNKMVEFTETQIEYHRNNEDE